MYLVADLKNHWVQTGGKVRKGPPDALNNRANIFDQLYRARVRILGSSAADQDRVTQELKNLLNEGAHLEYTGLNQQLQSCYHKVLELGAKYPGATSSPGISGQTERIREQLLPKVNESSLRAIQALERWLGTRMANDAENKDYRGEPNCRQATARPTLVWSPDNNLWRVWNALDNLLGDAAATDEVTQRLLDLLNKNVYLPRDRHLVRWRAHGSQVGASVLLSNTAKLVRAAREGLKGTLSDGFLKDLIDSIDNDRSALLHKNNFSDTRHFAGFASIYDLFRAALKDPQSELVLVAQGQDPQVDVPRQYSRMVQELMPGHELRLLIYFGRGLDGDGDAFVKAAIRLLRFLHLPFLKIFNLQPIPTAATTQDWEIKIRKTEEGDIVISFGLAAERDLTLGLKLTVGRATDLLKSPNANESHRAARGINVWVFGGFEALPNVGVRFRRSRNVSFRIPNEDQGRMQEFLEEFFGGASSEWDVLKQSNGASISRERLTTVHAALPFHPNLTFGCTLQMGRFQFKALLAMIAQTVLGFTYTRGKSNTIGATGTETRKVNLVTLGAQENVGYIAESQVAHPSGFGSEEQNKVPDRIGFRQWIWGGKQVENHGYTLVRDPDENLVAVRAAVRTSKAPFHDLAHWMMRFTEGSEHFNEKNIPQLRALEETHPEIKPYIEGLKKTKEPVLTTMEFTPSALDEVSRFLARFPRSDNALERLIRALMRRPPRSDNGLERLIRGLMRRPENLRIIRIEAIETLENKAGGSWGFDALRAQKGASTSYSYPNALIEISYGPDQEPTFDVSGSLFVPKNPTDFLLRQLPADARGRIMAEVRTIFRKTYLAQSPIGDGYIGASKAAARQLCDEIVNQLPKGEQERLKAIPRDTEGYMEALGRVIGVPPPESLSSKEIGLPDHGFHARNGKRLKL